MGSPPNENEFKWRSILVDPISLAVWYLDDGTKRQGFHGYRNNLSIPSCSALVFKELLYSFVQTEIPSMLYKLE